MLCSHQLHIIFRTSLGSRFCTITKYVPRVHRIQQYLFKRKFTKDNVNIGSENANVDKNTPLEEKIIWKLSNISPFKKGHVPVSKFAYIEMADRPRVRYLPEVDKIRDQNGINDYIRSLTAYRYPSSVDNSINLSLLKIVESVPEFLTKESYLLIVLYFHYIVRDDLVDKILRIMDKRSNIIYDVDFDNALLSVTLYNSNYINRVKRLEEMKITNTSANTNTWYYIFRVMHHTSPKIKILNIMRHLGITHKPILSSAIFCLSEEGTPEKLLEFLGQSGIHENVMTSFQLNRLLSCYLKHDRVNEAWYLINRKYQMDHKNLNGGSFVAFIDYFAARREIYNCIAFCNIFSKRYHLKTKQFLANELLNRHLLHMPYFKNWKHLVHILVYILKYESKNPTFLTNKSIDQLIAYAKLNGDDNFNPSEYKNSDFIMRHKLFNGLRWPSDMVKPDFLPVRLDDQSESFKEAASIVEIKNNKQPLNPTDLI